MGVVLYHEDFQAVFEACESSSLDIFDSLEINFFENLFVCLALFEKEQVVLIFDIHFIQVLLNFHVDKDKLI